MSNSKKSAQPKAQAGGTREACKVAGEVGVLHSSVDLWESITHGEPREGTCPNAQKRSKGRGDAPQGLRTPNKVRNLQITLYRKAKAEPKYRFWSLYGEVQRKDVLEAALEAVSENGGAPGVDGENVESISKTAEGQEKLDRGAALGIEGEALPGDPGPPSLDRREQRGSEAAGNSDGQRSCRTGSGVSGVNADLGG